MSPRVVFWRSFYAIVNPFRRLYWRVVQPETRGVKCLIKYQDRFLLIRLAYGHKQWTLPGGGVSKTESYEQGAIRELHEETGVRVAVLNFIGQYESRVEHKRDTVQCFYGEVNSVYTKCDALEVSEADWFSRSNFPIERGKTVDIIINLYDQWKT